MTQSVLAGFSSSCSCSCYRVTHGSKANAQMQEVCRKHVLANLEHVREIADEEQVCRRNRLRCDRALQLLDCAMRQAKMRR